MDETLRVSLANIGPVKNAQVDMKPLTVFIGPNNTGKSIVAAIIHALTGRQNLLQSRTLIMRTLRPRLTSESDVSTALIDLAENEIRPSFDAIPDAVAELLQSLLEIVQRNYATVAIQEIERITGASFAQLQRYRRSKSGPSTIKIESETPSWGVTLGRDSARAKKFPPVQLMDVWNYISEEGWASFQRTARSRPSPLENAADLSTLLVRAFFREYPVATRYLPASRAGLMQLSLNAAAEIALRDRAAISGAIADFLSEIVGLDGERRGDFDAEATSLELRVLGGTISVSVEAPGAPDIRYESDAGVLPLTRSSSGVAELAPVVVYLRYLLRRGERVFLEEPEAHLHPRAQVELARTVARLINDGLLACVTTHSEFFLQQLNNTIAAGGLDLKDAAVAGYGDGLRLSPTSVSAYLFKPTRDGTMVETLGVTAREGIPEGDFAEVEEELYKDSVALDYAGD